MTKTMASLPLYEFRWTRALKSVSLLSLSIGVYSVIPYLLSDETLFAPITEGLSGLEAAVGLVLGLLLVFRANRAYERWWEARSLWGKLVNCSRNLAIKIATIIQPKGEQAEEFADLIADFALALRQHLCSESPCKKLSGVDIPPHINHRPAYITQLLYNKISSHVQNNNISGEAFIIIDREVSQLMEVCGACEKIKNTLISISYRCFVHHIMFVMLLFLPWQIVEAHNAWTIPIVIIASYMVFGLEGIARNLEDPFGPTEDHVDMEGIANTIRKSANQILIDTPADNKN